MTPETSEAGVPTPATATITIPNPTTSGDTSDAIARQPA